MTSKELMIDRGNRPRPLDLDEPIADWTVRDLLSFLQLRAAEFMPAAPPQTELTDLTDLAEKVAAQVVLAIRPTS